MRCFLLCLWPLPGKPDCCYRAFATHRQKEKAYKKPILDLTNVSFQGRAESSRCHLDSLLARSNALSRIPTYPWMITFIPHVVDTPPSWLRLCFAHTIAFGYALSGPFDDLRTARISAPLTLCERSITVTSASTVYRCVQKNVYLLYRYKVPGAIPNFVKGFEGMLVW